MLSTPVFKYLGEFWFCRGIAPFGQTYLPLIPVWNSGHNTKVHVYEGTGQWENTYRGVSEGGESSLGRRKVLVSEFPLLN